MALLRSSLVLLLGLFVGCGSAIALGPGGERLLTSSNIEVAQKRVDGQIKHADASTVSGLAVKLHYIRKSGYQAAAVDLRIQGEDEVASYMVVDTGSSSMSFCDATLKLSIQNLKTKYAQANLYGDPTACTEEESCEVTAHYSSESDSKGHNEWYYGSVYQGNVEVYDKKSIYTMSNIHYAVMDDNHHVACHNGFDGIVGVAFQIFNQMKELPSVSTNAEVLLTKPCINDGCPLRRKTNNDYTEVSKPSPIQEALEDKSSTLQAFGIYFDYLTATNDIDVDGNTRDLGILYAGDLAKNNMHYNNGAQQVAKAIKYAADDKNTYWSINVKSVEIGGIHYNTDTCADAQNCIVDSGTPWINLPFSDSECYQMFANTTKNDSLKFHMKGMGDEMVTLEIPFTFIVDQYKKNKQARCGGDNLMLGFPIFAYYYIAYDFTEDSITFVSTTKQEIRDFAEDSIPDDTKEEGITSASSIWGIDNDIDELEDAVYDLETAELSDIEDELTELHDKLEMLRDFDHNL